MTKKYKRYLTRAEYIMFIFVFLFVLGGLLWTIFSGEYYPVLSVIAPLGIVLFSPWQYCLTEDNMLEMRHLFGRAFKPISVNQIVSCRQKSKKDLILVYFRDKLRGNALLSLSEADMADFIHELTTRNPAIEVKE